MFALGFITQSLKGNVFILSQLPLKDVNNVWLDGKSKVQRNMWNISLFWDKKNLINLHMFGRKMWKEGGKKGGEANNVQNVILSK